METIGLIDAARSANIPYITVYRAVLNGRLPEAKRNRSGRWILPVEVAALLGERFAADVDHAA
ncbi:MAG: hypothetical protein IOB84_07710 [Brevundimonas sp.]|nr:hypothetical protein [Brevundimonas sp.]